ncbi:MAG: PEP-CTERM sorting domain-containing protein [Sphingomonadales bacterium]|nr:MAG: PEP-CTERM sorting domain-containing protein [Sphingomonadales bacterium]
MRTWLLALLAAAMVCALGTPARAASLLVNGDFETTSYFYVHGTTGETIYPGTSWGQYFTDQNTGQPAQTVQGWTNSGYNFIYKSDLSASWVNSPQSPSFLALWGMPGTGINNGITTSPTGGNFVAADGAYLNAPISQTVTGLTAGRQYAVSFWWAAGQLQPYRGPTSDAWTVCFGTCAFTTDYNPLGDGYATFTPGAGSQIQQTISRAVPDQGFVPWRHEYIVFTAQSSTQTLSLLAYGTPVGTPPFAMIDGIRLDAVPEPSTWAMMLIGFGVVGGVMRTRRQPLSGKRAFKAQIV